MRILGKSALCGSSVLLLCVFALSGCAALRGSQERITSDDLGKSVCPSDDDNLNFKKQDPDDKGSFRNDVLSKCMDAVDKRYDDFKAALQKEAVSANLTTDLLALGLSGGATLVSGNSARDLSAGAAAVLGAGAAINKDVFYQQALPAIEAAMDANRIQIQTRIINAETADPTAKVYDLSRARSDIEAYQAAGSIYVAISQLTATADQKKQSTSDDLSKAKVALVAQLLPTDVYAREKKLSDDIRAYVIQNDRTTLDNIAKALSVAINPDLATEGANIRAAIDKKVTDVSVTDPKAAMDNLASTINKINGRTY